MTQRQGNTLILNGDASPASRISNSGCPYLSSNRRWPGFNDLKTIAPDLAAQWNYVKEW